MIIVPPGLVSGCIGDDAAVGDDELRIGKYGQVALGIATQQDHVGQFARLDRAQPVVHAQDAGADACRACKDRDVGKAVRIR